MPPMVAREPEAEAEWARIVPLMEGQRTLSPAYRAALATPGHSLKRLDGTARPGSLGLVTACASHWNEARRSKVARSKA